MWKLFPLKIKANKNANSNRKQQETSNNANKTETFKAQLMQKLYSAQRSMLYIHIFFCFIKSPNDCRLLDWRSLGCCWRPFAVYSASPCIVINACKCHSSRYACVCVCVGCAALPHYQYFWVLFVNCMLAAYVRL